MESTTYEASGLSHNKTKTQINYNRLQGVFGDQSSNKKKTIN